MSAGDDSGASGVELIRRAFSFLERDQGFRLGDVSERQRELSLSFVGEESVVTIHHEYFGGVDVHIRLRTDEAERDRDERWETFGLFLLVLDESPGDVALLGPERLYKEDGSLAACLERQAELLARHARDLLRGDPTRVPRLRRLRADETRRRNKAEFGTSTGETPRFTERPSLEELFSDATNGLLRCARAYQGFWDYDYTLAEMGAFLGVDESDVQALLDGWDRLG